MSDNRDIGVVARADVEVFDSGMTEESVVVQDVNVDVGNGGRVIGWVGQVHQRGYSQGRLGGIDDVQIEDFWLQLCIDGIAR